MKLRVILMLTAMFAVLTTGVFAASAVTGKWTAEVPARNGEKRVQTITLKADGEKLTGSISSPMGEREITDGTVKGDEISFTLTMKVQGEDRKMTYTGKVAGDEIQFKVTGGQREREFVAKRSTT